jgi:hypothetical protein
MAGTTRATIWRDGALLLTVVAVAFVAAAAYVFLIEPRLHPAETAADSAPFGGAPPAINTPMMWPGIRQPVAVKAEEARVEPGDMVIGVSAGGRHRAYLLRALSGPALQVVNDLVGDVPVTVTFSDRANHVSVFTGSVKGKPLDMGLGGWIQGRMVVTLNQLLYDQETGTAPNPDVNSYVVPRHEFVRMPWQEWHAAHPDTDIYVGATPNFGPPGADRKKKDAPHS